jgi:hypothetical protein
MSGELAWIPASQQAVLAGRAPGVTVEPGLRLMTVSKFASTIDPSVQRVSGFGRSKAELFNSVALC